MNANPYVTGILRFGCICPSRATLNRDFSKKKISFSSFLITKLNTSILYCFSLAQTKRVKLAFQSAKKDIKNVGGCRDI